MVLCQVCLDLEIAQRGSNPFGVFESFQHDLTHAALRASGQAGCKLCTFFGGALSEAIKAKNIKGSFMKGLMIQY
jgi:hypothetical protein